MKVDKKYLIRGYVENTRHYLSNDGFNFVTNIEEALMFKSKAKCVTYANTYFPSRKHNSIEAISVIAI